MNICKHVYTFFVHNKVRISYSPLLEKCFQKCVELWRIICRKYRNVCEAFNDCDGRKMLMLET